MSIALPKIADCAIASGLEKVYTVVKPTCIRLSRNDIIPLMTSDTTPSPYVISASEYLGDNYRPYMAFDNNSDSIWHTKGTSSPWWIKVDLGVDNGKVVIGYTIKQQIDNPTRAPKIWEFQGSNNDTDWIVLDGQNQINWTNTKRTYIFANSTSYRYYRLYITANNGDTYLTISEIEFLQYPTTSPSIESLWVAIPYNTLGTNPLSLFENSFGGTGLLKYQYALNNGAYNGTWLTLSELNTALSGAIITDYTNSLRLKAQFISNGSEQAELIIAGELMASGYIANYYLPLEPTDISTEYEVVEI